MHRSIDRLLTTHVGSLIRPPELVKLLRAQEADEHVDPQQLIECLEQSVASVVRQQCDAGLDIVNDGEFGKTISWSRYVLERLSGVVRRERRPDDHRMPRAIAGKDRRDFAEFYQAYDSTQGFTGMVGWAVTGPITVHRPARHSARH